MQRRGVISISVLLLALLGGGWLLVSYSNNQQPELEVQASQGAGWQVQLVQRAVRLQEQARKPWPFAPMRAQAEFMPPRFRHDAKATLGKGQQQLGLQFDRAQYVDTDVGIGIWVVRGKGVTCIFHAITAAAACNTNVDAGRRGLALVVGEGSSPSPGALPLRFLALGIAPDWARAVRLKSLASSSKRTAPVVDNAFAIRARGPISLEGLIR
jgi:hypothetical protein